MSVGPMLPTLDPGHSKQKQLKAGANYGNHDIVQCSCGQAMTYGTSTELEKLFTFERTGSILCFTLHTAFPYSSAMSRLCCPDPELFARYCNNELATDLCLKSSSQDSACHSVCSALLQTYSDQLAGFAKIKLATAADASSTCKTVLVLEGAQPGALKVFVGAMYGSSMKEALCPSPDNEEDPPVRLVDLMELYSFGHKYNIGQMDPALCDIITTHVQKLAETSCMSDAVEFYNSIPEDLPSHPLQDAILQILVYMHKNWSCGLMDIDIRIHPRHVNVLLEGCSKAPRDALALLEHCVSQEVKNRYHASCVLPFPYRPILLQSIWCKFAGAKGGSLGPQALDVPHSER